MSVEENKAVVRKFIEAFSDGDAASAKECLAPDAMTVAKGFGKLSGERPYDIIVATTAAFKDLIPTGLRPSFVSLTGEGDRVAVEFVGDAVLASGEKYANEYCMVFYMANGKIKKVNEYYCTLLADQKVLPLLADIEAKRHANEGNEG